MCRTEDTSGSSTTTTTTSTTSTTTSTGHEEEPPGNIDSTTRSSNNSNNNPVVETPTPAENMPTVSTVCSLMTPVRQTVLPLPAAESQHERAGHICSRGRRATLVAFVSVVLVAVVGVRFGYYCDGGDLMARRLNWLKLNVGGDARGASMTPETDEGRGKNRRALGALLRKLRRGGENSAEKGKKRNRRKRKQAEEDSTLEQTQTCEVKIGGEECAAHVWKRNSSNSIGGRSISRKERKAAEKAAKAEAKAEAKLSKERNKREARARAKAEKAASKALVASTRRNNDGKDASVSDVGGDFGKIFHQKTRLNALWKKLSVVGGALNVKRRKAGGAGGAGNEQEYKARLLDQLKRDIATHPGDLYKRGKAVRHELGDDTLNRYLEYAYWGMEYGGEPLVSAIDKTMTWREKAGPHLIEDKDVIDEAAYGKLYVRGHDREGRPIIYFNPGEERSFDTEKGLALLFHTLERATASLPLGQTQFAVVADCAGFGPSKTPPVAMIKTAFMIMQHHYPMRLGYVVIVNAGSPIVFVWKLISHVLCARTHEKIAFLSPKEAAAMFHKHIDPATLPSRLPGGRDPFRYSNDVYFSG